MRCVGAEHPQDPMSVYASTHAHTGLFSPTGSAIFISNRMFLDRAGFDCLIGAPSAVNGALIRPQTRIAAAIRAHPDSYLVFRQTHPQVWANLNLFPIADAVVFTVSRSSQSGPHSLSYRPGWRTRFGTDPTKPNPRPTTHRLSA